MAESLVQVTEGTGKKLHTNSYVVGANTVEDEFTVPGEYPYATYSAVVQSMSIAGATPQFQLMAGGSLKVRVRRIHIEQRSSATAAGLSSITISRLTSAGTGGTAVTPRPYDSADAASGATAMSLPTAIGGAGVTLLGGTMILRQAVAATGAQVDDQFEWVPAPNEKSIVIPAGATNGLSIGFGVLAGATVDVWIEFVETSF